MRQSNYMTAVSWLSLLEAPVVLGQSKAVCCTVFSANALSCYGPLAFTHPESFAGKVQYPNQTSRHCVGKPVSTYLQRDSVPTWLTFQSSFTPLFFFCHKV